MCMRRSFLASLAVCILASCYANSVHAQIPRIRIQQNSYDVTIVSEFGYPVRVGIFGFTERATFRLTFDGGRTGPDVYTQELIAGDRVLIVWDMRGRRLLVADLPVTNSGTLVLGPQIAMAAKRADGAAAARGAAPARGAATPRGADAAKADKANAIPRLKIKPKK